MVVRCSYVLTASGSLTQEKTMPAKSGINNSLYPFILSFI